MRLIDADKIGGVSADPYEEGAFQDEIRSQPTVDAITVEWIEDWQKKHEWKYQSYFEMRDGKPKYAIECMIEDWRKENETN